MFIFIHIGISLLMMSHNTKSRKWNAIDFHAYIGVHCTYYPI